MSILDDLEADSINLLGLEKYKEIIAEGNETFEKFEALGAFIAIVCMVKLMENGNSPETVHKLLQTAILTGISLYRQLCLDYGLDIKAMEDNLRKS